MSEENSKKRRALNEVLNSDSGASVKDIALICLVSFLTGTPVGSLFLGSKGKIEEKLNKNINRLEEKISQQKEERRQIKNQLNRIEQEFSRFQRKLLKKDILEKAQEK